MSEATGPHRTPRVRRLSLRARLLIFGALLPTVALFLAFLGAAAVFEARLLAHVDEALLGQAAVESVSLFDRATPHLHQDHSPLQGARSLAAATALYDAEGRQVATAGTGDRADGVSFPDTLPEAVAPPVGAPSLETVGRWRQLAATVPAPDGRAYRLMLRTHLGEHQRTVRTFYGATGSGVVAVGLLLGLIQGRHARRLEARVRRLAEHMVRVRDGHLDARLSPDGEADVITQLGQDIADATERLAAARAARSRFVADAAHELRTPLAAMRASLDVTLRRARTREALLETLEETRHEVERLTALSARLLDLARLDRDPVEADAGARAPGDLRVVAEAAVDAARGTAEAADVDLVLRAPMEALAFLDAETVRQALDNLLANALRHAPEGSRVELRIAPQPEASGGGWRITVRDDGPGVPADQREAIFSPFVRLDRAHAGAGLGLAIVAAVARQHGGAAQVEDRPGGVFTLVLGPG